MLKRSTFAVLFLLAAAPLAAQEVRTLSDAEVQSFLPLARARLRQLDEGPAAVEKIGARLEELQRLNSGVLSGAVDPRAWLEARNALRGVPAEARYEAACSRSLGANPADMPDDALRSDLATPEAVFVMPWKGTPVKRVRDLMAAASTPHPEGRAAWEKLRAEKRALAASLKTKGWVHVTESMGSHYLVTKDTTVVMIISDDFAVNPACAAVGNGMYTGPMIRVQALQLHEEDPAERWEAVLEKSGWDEQRFGDVFFQLRLARQFTIGSEEVEIWRAGRIIPPATNLALYRRYAAQLDPLLVRFDKLGS